MRSRILVLPALLISATCVASDFNELWDQVPAGGNAFMAIDVAKTLTTPIAMKNGWDRKLTENGSDRPLYLPPEADKVLSVANFDIVRNFQRSWNVSLFSMTDPIPLKLVARAEGGYVDKISDVDVVWLPSCWLDIVTKIRSGKSEV